MTNDNTQMTHADILTACGLTTAVTNAGDLAVFTPVDGNRIAGLATHSVAEATAQIAQAKTAF